MRHDPCLPGEGRDPSQPWAAAFAGVMERGKIRQREHRGCAPKVRLIERHYTSGESALKILTGEGAAVDTTQPQGRMVFGILAVMAEFERELMSERTMAGIEAAKKRGVRVGRPLKLSEYQRREAVSMLDDGKARSDIAALLGVHVGTLRRALKIQGG